MSNTTLAILIAIVSCAVIALFVINFTPLNPFAQQREQLSQYEVRGMATVHYAIPFTLNFDEQNQVVAFVNSAVVLPSVDPVVEEELEVQELIVYQFSGKPDQKIVLLGVDDQDNVIFSAPFLYSDGYLQDTSRGQFKQLLLETYDS